MSRVSDRVVLDIYRDGEELVAIVVGLGTAGRLMARSPHLFAFERESLELWWGPLWLYPDAVRSEVEARMGMALEVASASDEPPPVEPR